MIDDAVQRRGEPWFFLVPEDNVFYVEAEERGTRGRYWMFRRLGDAEKCLLFLNHQGGRSPESPLFRWYRRGLHPRVSLSKPDPTNAPSRVNLTVDDEPTDRGWMGMDDAISLSHVLLLSYEELEHQLRQHVSSGTTRPRSGQRDTNVAGAAPQADPHLDELISRWQRWRRIYASAGRPAHDEPVWESGRLHLREGYPFPDWTSYIVDPADGGYYVLTATTERRNNPLEGSAGFFTDADDASKYLIWNLGENLRMNCRLDPIAWAWEDNGLDARVRWTPRADFVSKYELIAEPSRYFILRTGGIQPENHLLPMTYDELEAQPFDGMPEELRSEISPTLKHSSVCGVASTKPTEGASMPADIAATLAKLPATPGITYRGLSGTPTTSAITLTQVMPTSADPRVATENFTAERVVAIVTITGRSIGPLSRYPDQMEVALLPATLLVPVGSVAVPGIANDVVLLAEAGTAPGLPADLPELKRVVSTQVSAALHRPPATIHSPGRFSTPRG